MQGDGWQDFHDGFVKLAEIQQQIARATRKEFLQADCNFSDPEFDSTPKGPFCELPILEAAILEFREGPDEHLRAQLELLAARAGKKLGCPGNVSPLTFWLWNLFLHLRTTKSKHLFAPIHEGKIADNPRGDLLKPLAGLTFYRAGGGTITNVCVASAIFCSRLEKNALESPASQPASSLSQGVRGTEAEQRKPADATPAVSSVIERGKSCLQVIDEIRRIKNLCVGTGRSVAEIQNEHSDWAVWKVRDSLAQGDRDTLNHPRQWGPIIGYAKKILAKNYGVSEHTITARVKAYRKSQRPKKS